MLKLWRYPPQKIQSSHLKQQKLNSKNKHGRLWCMKPKTAFFTPVFEFFRVCLRFASFFFWGGGELLLFLFFLPTSEEKSCTKTPLSQNGGFRATFVDLLFLLPWSLEQALPLVHSHQYDHFNRSARWTEFDSDQSAYMDTRLSIRVVYYY